MTAGMFGLTNSNRDFTVEAGWGKNVFTNSFPVALASYMGSLGLGLVRLSAESTSGALTVRQELVPFDAVFGVSSSEAKYLFETSFEPYRDYTHQDPEHSDLVVAGKSGHTVALEIKLTTVPDNQTAKKAHDLQSCELVFRPLMIEQLAVSICATYGKQGRMTLNSLLNASITNPAQVKWEDESAMLARLPQILDAAEELIKNGMQSQRPMLLHPIWRTKGQSPELADECFDVFVWTNLAWMTMLLDQSRTIKTKITRPQRSLIWLVKMLWDYSVQSKLDRADTFTKITYDNQTDKAAAFGGSVTHRYLKGPYLSSPRIPASAVAEIILGEGFTFIAPERRLDAAIAIQLIKDNHAGA